MMVSIEQARELYAGSDSVHDFAHVLRVLRLALPSTYMVDALLVEGT